MAESAGTHGAVRHDGGLVHVLDMAFKACISGCRCFVVFRIIQLGSGSHKAVSQPANHDHSDQGHEPEKVSLSCFFCHKIKISWKLLVRSGDGFDFNFCAFGKGSDLNTSAGGFALRKKTFIDRIHACEMIKIGQIDRCLDNMLE